MADTLNKGYIVKNYQSLLTHGHKRLREAALAIIQEGINEADPGIGTHKAIKLSGHTLAVGKREYNLRRVDHVYVVGAGKGAFPIAESLEKILGSRIDRGTILVKKGERRRLKRIEVIEAGHPIPDNDSIMGANRVLEIASSAGDLTPKNESSFHVRLANKKKGG